MENLAEQKIPGKSKRRLLIFVLLICVIGGTIYYDALYGLISAVLHREGSSHGLFMPFLSAYLLWTKRESLVSSAWKTNWPAGVGCLFVGAVLLQFSTHPSYFLVFSIISFFFVTSGLILLFFGASVFRVTVFPLFLLLTMIPLPQALYAQLAAWMRSITTWGSVLITSHLGVPVYREEYLIALPGVDLFVANSCSGIRFLLSYFAFSLVYAIVFREGLVARFVIILGSIPLAMVAGIARLSAIFLAAHYIHPAMAEPRPHILISWVVFAVFLFGAMAADQYISERKMTASMGGHRTSPE